MPLSDVAFSRATIGSLVAFGVLTLVYFRLYGRRATIVVTRHLSILLPCAGLVSIGGAIAFDAPLVVRVILCFLGGSIAFAYLLALIVFRPSRFFSKPAAKNRPPKLS
jgi:hypothetical protein